MASSSSQMQTPRRIPGAPPDIFLEGAGFSYNTDPAPLSAPPLSSSSSQNVEDPWDFGWLSSKTKKKKKTRAISTDWNFDNIGKGKGKEKAVEEDVPVTLPYQDEDVPVFGKPFGFGWKKENASAEKGSPTVKRVVKKKTLNPYEDLLAEADNDLDLYAEGKGKLKLTSFGKSPSTPFQNISGNSTSGSKVTDTASWRDDIKEETPPFPPSSNPPKTCTVCMEDFTPRTKPPAWISLACMHEPAVCTTCITTSIKSDLDSKMWDQIQCPECGTHLIYDDVRRLADAITFARYEVLSFRSAVSTDPNFIWCRSCSFGQLHTSGSSSPIVRCLNCNALSCFKHQVPWHTRLTCAEYDSFLSDPDSFVSSVDRSNSEAEIALSLQKQEDEKVARDIAHQQRLDEQRRQIERHREVKEREREIQREEARSKREAWERDETKRRVKEENASMKMVEKTTKRCPGCQWPIEKNEGCAHMTCTQCHHQFCWNCMKKWFGHGSRC